MLMMSSEFLLGGNYPKSNYEEKLKKKEKIGGLWGGPWKGSKGWSMNWGSVFSTLLGACKQLKLTDTLGWSLSVHLS